MLCWVGSAAEPYVRSAQMGLFVTFRLAARHGDAAAALAVVLLKTVAIVVIPTAWAATAAGEGLGALIEAVMADKHPERKLRRDLESIADDIAKTSVSLIHLADPGEDINPAIYAVKDTLDAVSVDAELIVGSGFSADLLYKYYLENDAGRVRKAGLGSTEWAYYRLMREISARIVGVLKLSDPAQGIAIGSLFEQVRHITAQLDYPVALHRSLAKVDDLFHYRIYQDRAGHRLALRKLNRRNGRLFLAQQATFVEPRVIKDGVACSLGEAVAGSRRIFLIGSPGAGKTMLLQHLFLKVLAHEGFGGLPEWGAVLPLYIDLSRQHVLPALGDVPKALNDSLASIPGRWAQDRAANGSAAILLDNVEWSLCSPTNGASNLDVIEEWLTQTATNSRYVIAARRGMIEEQWLAENDFTTVELAPFDIEDTLTLIRRWYSAVADQCVASDEAQAILDQAEALILGIGMQSDLADMMSNPLLARLVCEEFLDSGLQLPQDWIELVDKVLDRIAELDAGNTPEPAGQYVKRASDIQQAVAKWCLLNRASLNKDYLAQAMSGFSTTEAPVDAAPLLDQVLAHYSILHHTGDGVSFVSDVVRDHLAACVMITEMYLGYFKQQASVPGNTRISVAAAGRLKQDLVTGLVAELLNEVDAQSPAAKALAAVTLCAAQASRTIEPAVLHRAISTAARFVPPAGDEHADLFGVAQQALDMLTRAEAASGEQFAAVVRCALALARHLGERSLAALAVLAARAVDGEDGLFWEAWSSFDRLPYARLVLARLPTPSTVLIVGHPHEAIALKYLPAVTVVEARIDVPAVLLSGRKDIVIRVARQEMILQAELLDPSVNIEVIEKSEGRDGRG